MKRLAHILWIFLLSMYCAQGVSAEHVTIVAEDIKGRAVRNVRFSVLATGLVSAPTTSDGRTQMALPAGLKPGASMELRVGRVSDIQEDWVFISPWDGWVKVPEPGGYCKAILARRGDREALVSSDGTRAMTASILAAINKQTALNQTLSEEQRKIILKEQAERFGLSPEQIDKAIRAWKDSTQDPFDVGIAALYERNYPQATAQLAKSLKLREKQEAESREKVAEASYFLAQSFYEQGRYAEASENYRKAAERRADDAATLNAFGVSLIKAAAFAEAKPILEQSLAIREKSLGKEHPDTKTMMSNLEAIEQKLK